MLLKNNIKGINDIWLGYCNYISNIINQNNTYKLKSNSNNEKTIYINDIKLIDKKDFIDIISCYFNLCKIRLINGERLYINNIGFLYISKKKQPNNRIDFYYSKKYNKKLYHTNQYYIYIKFLKNNYNVNSFSYKYQFKKARNGRKDNKSNSFETMLNDELKNNPNIIYKY